MVHINTQFIGDTDIEPLTFCGNTIMYRISSKKGTLTLPFEIEATEGEHDYKVCESCQKSLEHYTKELEDRFAGRQDVKAFPNCCKYHANLKNIKEFDVSDFENAPSQAARKMVYTTQHITNNIASDNWYKKITDYIEWVCQSFGTMPNNCGEPLYLSNYLYTIKRHIKKDAKLPSDKRAALLSFLDSYIKPSPPPKSGNDIKNLIETYEKWLDLFPFEISFINSIKPKFEKNLPLISGTFEKNLYSGITSFETHTKKSLVKLLDSMTKQLLETITKQIPALRENNIITDHQSTWLELRDAQLIRETAAITRQFSKGELKYLKTLKKWLRLHKDYFKELEPIFLNKQIINPAINDTNTPIINKTISFKNEDSILLVFDLLKDSFNQEEMDNLKTALEGTNLSDKLYFPHSSNKFVEVFRRLKYNGYILSTTTELRSWICSNFCYFNKKRQQKSNFNENTVWDILSKGKGEPNRNSRICNVEWLPYKNPYQLKNEKQQEKLQ